MKIDDNKIVRCWENGNKEMRYIDAIQWLMKNRNLCEETAKILLNPCRYKDCISQGNASEPNGIIKVMMDEIGEYST